ncbi:MAG: phenylalanine--tRNA ligase subunit alpha, partial [Bacilli bacterium]|nr:phenylalanine--tRNA ligase subunit alpha [Bacilli bacterium]
MEKIIDLDEAKKKILDCKNLKELNDLRVFYLGKKSMLNQSMSKMGELSQDERIEFGKYVNTLKQDLNGFLEEQKNNLEAIELNERLQNETIDISLDGDDFSSASYGIIGSIVDEICNIGIGIGFSIAEGPEVENDHYNFEMLNLPKDHPA